MKEKSHIDDILGEVENHPAFGIIKLNSVSATPGKAMFQSDFVHNHYIAIRICRAEKRRSPLHSSDDYSRKEIIEIGMTESQFARFVASNGDGGGTPCTLMEIDGERMPELPIPATRRMWDDEMQKQLQDSMKATEEAMKMLAGFIGAGTIGKKKGEELSWKLNLIMRGLKGNADFFLEQFGKHMQAVTNEAKNEIDGYLRNRIKELGGEALAVRLAGGGAPLQLTREVMDEK